MSDLVGGVAFVLGGFSLWGLGAWAADEPEEDYLLYVGPVVSLFGLMLLLLLCVAFPA